MDASLKMFRRTPPDARPGPPRTAFPAGAALLAVALSLSPPHAGADPVTTEFGGHVKGRVIATHHPDDSLFRDLAGAGAVDGEGDVRLNLAWRKDGWRLHVDYQMAAFVGDQVELARRLPGGGVFFPLYPDDDRRLMDLTHVLREGERSLWLQRLDRLWLGWSSDRVVLRVGRQSLSWGNGLFYAPMDLVNPFDPATIDTEYKFGDDMLYAQFLRDNGDDLQFAAVARRDPRTGETASDQGTLALKYHGFAGAWEYDLLVAEHYDDLVLAGGVTRALGDALWRADLVFSDTPSGDYVQLVSNLSTSWVWRDRNMTGTLEYFYNEFGLRDGPYDADRLAANPELLRRLARGDLFTLGRHNLAASLLVELTPLWTTSPTLLTNLGDGSALFQLVSQVSLADELVLLGSVNLPLGSNGTEFGGIESPVDGKFLSFDAGVFVQLARYF